MFDNPRVFVLNDFFLIKSLTNFLKCHFYSFAFIYFIYFLFSVLFWTFNFKTTKFPLHRFQKLYSFSWKIVIFLNPCSVSLISLFFLHLSLKTKKKQHTLFLSPASAYQCNKEIRFPQQSNMSSKNERIFRLAFSTDYDKLVTWLNNVSLQKRKPDEY